MIIKEIPYVLPDNYAEHEIAFLPGAVKTDEMGFRQKPKYENKIVASTMEPVKSIGGLRTLPHQAYGQRPPAVADVGRQELYQRGRLHTSATLYVPKGTKEKLYSSMVPVLLLNEAPMQ